MGVINSASLGREKVKDFVPAGNPPMRRNPRQQSNVERQRVVEAGHEDLGIEVGGVCDDPPAVEIRVHVPNAIVCPHYPFGFDLLGVLNELLDKFSIPSFLQLVLALLVPLPFNVIDRQHVVLGKSVYVRVDHGGTLFINKKNKIKS